MKTWQKKDEWTSYANCVGDSRFISESDLDDLELRSICAGCNVRPECIKWAVDGKVSAVFVAGVRLPDPAHKKSLRLDHERLRATYDDELVERGEF